MTDAASTKRPLCFVIGPIGEDNSKERRHADYLLHGIIKHVLEAEEFGYTVKRADEDAYPGMISDRMISDIFNADLVVADLTDLNANAFYELGIRHSAEKPTIHLARADTKLPFDNAPIGRFSWISPTGGTSNRRATNLGSLRVKSKPLTTR